jgi:hypothetical protein
VAEEDPGDPEPEAVAPQAPATIDVTAITDNTRLEAPTVTGRN